MVRVVRETQLPHLPVRRGKVRDIYDLGSSILLVATDRISAFDCVLPGAIPFKGQVLTAISRFWFKRFENWCPHHLIDVVDRKAPPGLESHLDALRGRAMVCRRAEVIPIECVARGYVAGSGWKEYQETGSVCGIRLPAYLRQSDRLPEPIFTPATKAETGHDENISFDEVCNRVGAETAEHVRQLTLRLYAEAAEYARSRGIIIADTKFEFGRTPDGEVILIDEVLTPDSSRFWPADRYEPGRDQPSFDKQFVRNYLQALCDAGKWNKTPPAPSLPDDIVSATSKLYLEAYERITGQCLND
jgi:phosphoribosylaminoimidazole-succinocarboxamide synthase